jgi:hypothetical protein
MDKLEQYLDQVCRNIGGPPAMRAHVRQELREHLLDAVAGHKAARLSEAEAVAKALEEFGKVEEVRSELEATHGQRRMMAVVIDKALEWKEKTMKAKWLWMSWAYLALALVIVLQVLFITFSVIVILPKYEKLMHDGIIDLGDSPEEGVMWMVDFLKNLQYVCGHHTTFMLLFAIVAVGLFEWLVKSENKTFIRLSALGTISVALTLVAALMAASMVVLFCLGVPAMGRIARPWTLEQVASVDSSLSALEKAMANKDWAEMDKQAELASNAVTRLSVRVAATSLARANEAPTVDDLRAHVKDAQENLRDVRQAITARDAERLRVELAKLRRTFEPIREVAKRPPR